MKNINFLSIIIACFFNFGCARLAIELPASISIQRIEVYPTTKTLPKNVYYPLQALAVYSDGTTSDITTHCSWSSEDTGIITVSTSGSTMAWLVGTNAGTVNIVATYGSFTAKSQVVISSATLSSISITPAASSKAKGLTQQFTAMGTYSDSSVVDITSSVTWSSTNSSFVNISNSNPTKGLATTPGIGSVTIQASLDSISNTTTFTVSAATLTSIDVTPANSTVIVGLFKQFTATGTYTDGSTADLTTAVVWTSSSGTIIISNTSPTQGKATGVGLGSSVITATSGSVSGYTTLNGI